MRVSGHHTDVLDVDASLVANGELHCCSLRCVHSPALHTAMEIALDVPSADELLSRMLNQVSHNFAVIALRRSCATDEEQHIDESILSSSISTRRDLAVHHKECDEKIEPVHVT